MKLNDKAYSFAQRILKLNAKEVQNNSKPKETNTEPDNTRIIGTTDYKKYEEMAKNIAMEEIKQNPRTNDALKMGCNNDLRKERQLFDKPSKDKIDAAKLFKNEGDDFLKSKDFENAVSSYEKGLLQLFYTFSNDPEEDRAVDTIKCTINMNLSICKMNLKKYDEAIGYCQEALRIDKNNLKAIYRIAYSYLQTDKLDDAKKYVDEGLKVDPNSKDFIDLGNQINHKIRDNEDNARKFFKKLVK
jgi:tetratricopeptide (TPR) repeat protein